MYKYLFLTTITLLISSCSSETETDSRVSESKLADEHSATSYRLQATESKTSLEEHWNPEDIMEYERNLPTLIAAIDFYKKDLTSVEPEKGGVSEFLWDMVTWDQAVGITWEAINDVPETSYPKMKKDMFAEVGKSFCFEGMVHEIEVDRSIKPPITKAKMYVPYEGYIVAIAVKSSGDIVKDSVAGFCGVATGSLSYSTYGGDDSVPVLIGMFDLPENK